MPRSACRCVLLCLLLSALGGQLWAAPSVRTDQDRTIVEGASYRATFTREAFDIAIELRGDDGQWQPVTRRPKALDFGVISGDNVLTTQGLRATWALSESADTVAVGMQTVLEAEGGRVLQVHFVCADEGLLIGAEVLGEPGEGTLWAPPRIMLDPGAWDGYTFWDAAGKLHRGDVSALQPYPAYAGISPWGRQGDTADALDPARPALIVSSQARGLALGVVFVGYPEAWQGGFSFLQRHTEEALYLYAGTSPASPSKRRWAWLAPFSPERG